jgi:sterol desaturase/sphingolipid hydroxylase (fatty acid hydroxylase superfamily)
MILAGLGQYYAIAIPALLLELLASAEAIWPRRALVLGRNPRWRTHALFFVSNAVIGRMLSFLVVVGMAANWADTHKFGALNLVALPFWVEAAIAFIVLDFAVWLQHFFMHRTPLLWRMHAVHHSDCDLDVTTALRFHPFELIVSTFYKSAIVALLGVPLLVALAFEIWLNANALFNHSNIRLPRKLDRILRLLLVTPDMHLVHHSTLVDEQKHNFGFALTLWDRAFGTYRAESILGAENQKIGLAMIDDGRASGFIWSMKQPLT